MSGDEIAKRDAELAAEGRSLALYEEEVARLRSSLAVMTSARDGLRAEVSRLEARWDAEERVLDAVLAADRHGHQWGHPDLVMTVGAYRHALDAMNPKGAP